MNIKALRALCPDRMRVRRRGRDSRKWSETAYLVYAPNTGIKEQISYTMLQSYNNKVMR